MQIKPAKGHGIPGVAVLHEEVADLAEHAVPGHAVVRRPRDDVGFVPRPRIPLYALKAGKFCLRHRLEAQKCWKQ